MTKFAKTILAAMLTTAPLGACVTATPYEPASSASDTGYRSQRIADDRYRISFEGNSVTDRSTVENYLLYRAAELTQAQGYDGFTVVREDTERTVDANVTPSYGAGTFGGFSPYWRYRRIGFGYSLYDPFIGSPFLGGADVRTVDSYEAYATIRMYRGVRGGAQSYVATQVLSALADTIELPE